MRILINDTPIDFQLEDERTVSDIVGELRAWLANSGHFVREVIVDGTASEAEWRDRNIAEITEIRLVAENPRGEMVEALETIISYVDLLRRVLTEGSDDQLAAVMEELPYVRAGIDRVTPDLAGLLEEPLDPLPTEPEARRRAAERAREMAAIFESRQRELLEPESEMQATLVALDEILPRFEEVPAEIQDGDGAAAMATVTRFTEVAARVLRMVPLIAATRPELAEWPVGDRTLAEALPGLVGQLEELERAFAADDLVLVGDLLEYEMLPRFGALSHGLRAALAARG